jgi:Copper transport outer membrane protein, MctB
MFDFRYHALSLAAVLMALVVGLLLGVAIGDSNLVSSAKRGIVRNLQSTLDSAHQQVHTLSQERQLEQKAAEDLYDIAVHHVIAARRIGLLFLGSSSDQVDGLVREAVTDAGGDLVSVLAVREPLNLEGLAHVAGPHYVELANDPRLIKQLGTHVGLELANGGTLLDRVRGPLLSSLDGELGKLDGLVVVRQQPTNSEPQAAKSITEFEQGLFSGLGKAGLNVVGVELSSTEPSQVPWYKSQNMASVDDLNELAGRAALVFALAGAHGAYGIKPSADALLPRLVQGGGLR